MLVFLNREVLDWVHLGFKGQGLLSSMSFPYCVWMVIMVSWNLCVNEHSRQGVGKKTLLGFSTGILFQDAED